MSRSEEGPERASSVGCVDPCEAVYRGLADRLGPYWRTVWYPTTQAAEAESSPARVWVMDVHGFVEPIDVARTVSTLRRTGALVVYTFECRTAVLEQLRSIGVDHVVDKRSALCELEGLIRTLARQEATGRRAGRRRANTRLRYPLSTRQLQVLRGRARGESFPSIGERLQISPRTAAEYFGVIQTKYSDFLASHSAADLEYELGVGPGDLFDWSAHL